MNANDLDPKLIEKARACKTTEELTALAKAEGIELTGEQLDAASGGGEWDHPCTNKKICLQDCMGKGA